MSLMALICLVFSGCFQEEKTPKKNSQLDQAARPAPAESAEINKPNNSANQNESAENSAGNEEWVFYTNEKYGYQFKYPSDWYFLKDGCCPPPPAAINFNNYSDTQEEYATHQFEKDVYGINVYCNYEGSVDDIGEVQLQKKEGAKNETKKINGFDAIIFSKDQTPGDSSVRVKNAYIVNGQQGCRITFDTNCAECPKILESFKFNK